MVDALPRVLGSTTEMTRQLIATQSEDVSRGLRRRTSALARVRVQRPTSIGIAAGSSSGMRRTTSHDGHRRTDGHARTARHRPERSVTARSAAVSAWLRHARRVSPRSAVTYTVPRVASETSSRAWVCPGAGGSRPDPGSVMFGCRAVPFVRRAGDRRVAVRVRPARPSRCDRQRCRCRRGRGGCGGCGGCGWVGVGGVVRVAAVRWR